MPRYIEEHFTIYNVDDLNEHRCVLLRLSCGALHTQTFSYAPSESTFGYSALEESILRFHSAFTQSVGAHLRARRVGEAWADSPCAARVRFWDRRIGDVLAAAAEQPAAAALTAATAAAAPVTLLGLLSGGEGGEGAAGPPPAAAAAAAGSGASAAAAPGAAEVSAAGTESGAAPGGSAEGKAGSEAKASGEVPSEAMRQHAALVSMLEAVTTEEGCELQLCSPSPAPRALPSPTRTMRTHRPHIRPAGTRRSGSSSATSRTSWSSSA